MSIKQQSCVETMKQHMKEWVQFLKARSDNGQHMQIPSELSAGACFDLAVELEKFIAATEESLCISDAAATQEPDHWNDRDDQWTEEIKASHPVKTKAYHHYDTAMKMVGARHSKGALVDLVCWLLQKADTHPQPKAEHWDADLVTAAQKVMAAFGTSTDDLYELYQALKTYDITQPQPKAEQERHELQKDGKHPAPCARFCEANAFNIEIRGLKRRIEQLTAEQEQKREPLTDEQLDELIRNAEIDEMGYMNVHDVEEFARAIEASHGIHPTEFKQDD